MFAADPVSFGELAEASTSTVCLAVAAARVYGTRGAGAVLRTLLLAASLLATMLAYRFAIFAITLAIT